MGSDDESPVAIDEIIEQADDAFEKGEFGSASAGWETAFNAEEIQGDPELKKDLAWNIGLSEALQNNVERSQWYFTASGYGREHFQARGIDEVYTQIMLAGQATEQN